MSFIPSFLLTLIFLCIIPLPILQAADRPRIMLADTYQEGLNVSQYWVSEKLDGIRARWDGTRLLSRGGHTLAPPEWFTKHFPILVLDGELWLGRGRYEDTASIVRKQYAHEGWRQIRFMIFDLPEHLGTFDERVMAMKNLATQIHSPYLAIIEQHTFSSEEDLKEQWQSILDLGGEGFMLHRKTAYYVEGRSPQLLKLKPYTDAEATVIGYRPGKGKFTGQVGSLKVEMGKDRVFYIGRGLSNAQRRTPPPLQSRITFRHQGFTKNGIPRFPVFLRIRNEQPE